MPDYFYYTYGGFDTIANALLSLSLIFGNSSFQGIFYTAMVLGLALGIMAFYIRVISGAQLSPVSLVVTFAISASLYLGLFVPKCKVHVEDKTTGKFQDISGIPLGMGATLGVLNKIEVGINEDIIQPTFGVFYKDSAGGRGIEAILYLLTSGFATSTKYSGWDQTIQRYFDDCVVFEAGRPNGSVSISGIMNGSIPLETAFANSANPAVWTIDYTVSNAGTTETCDVVWGVLNTKLSDPSFVKDAFLKPTCAAAGFDISDAYYQSCINVLSGHLAWLASAPGTKYDSSSLTLDINTFAKRTYLASMIAQVVEQNGVVPLANIQMLQHSTSTALVLNNWLPYIKAATTSIFILIAPFILVFLPTPLFSRALSLVVGLFIWLTVWSIVDALAHNSLTFYISSAFEKFRESFADLPSYQYGLTAIYQMREPLYKSLAFLGYVRGAGVVLASAIAYGLFKFGGYAFTQFAGGLQEMTARAGHESADHVMNPAGARSTQNANLESSAYWGTTFEQRRAAAQGHVGWGIASGMAQEEAIRSFGFSSVTQSMFYDTARNISANQKVIAGLGGGNPLVAANMASSVSAGELIGKVNEFTNQARARGITTLEMGAQFSSFQTATGLAKMDATMGFADYLVQTGQAKNYYDAYRKMDEFGLLGKAVGAAAAYGGDRNRFLKDISTLTAAKMGDINALRQVALATRGSASDENVQWVRENISRPELLNELAKFQVRSKFAQALGIMKNDQDYQGFYEYLKLSQGIDKLTLNKDMANRLNEIMHNAGYTNFNAKEGDIATIAFTPDGMPHYAITGRGGKSETFDVDSTVSGFEGRIVSQISERVAFSPKTKEGLAALQSIRDAIKEHNPNAARGIAEAIKRGEAVSFDITRTKEGDIASVKMSTGATFSREDFKGNLKGWENVTKALTVNEWGSRETGGHKRDVTNTNFTGNRSANYNESIAQGVFTITDPNTGQPIQVSGTFMFNPETKQLVAANYTNLKTGEIFTAQLVTDKGEQKWQYGVSKVQVGPDGKMRQTFSSLSERDVSTGGYASHQTFSPDGTKLYEKADAGQNVTWWHQFKMKFEKGADVSLFGAVVPNGSDLTNLSEWQYNVIYAGGATKVAVERAMDGVNIYKGAKMPENAPKTMPRQPSLEVKPKLYDPYGHLIQ